MSVGKPAFFSSVQAVKKQIALASANPDSEGSDIVANDEAQGCG